MGIPGVWREGQVLTAPITWPPAAQLDSGLFQPQESLLGAGWLLLMLERLALASPFLQESKCLCKA